MGNLMPKESYSNISDISLDYLINDIKILVVLNCLEGMIFKFTPLTNSIRKKTPP